MTIQNVGVASVAAGTGYALTRLYIHPTTALSDLYVRYHTLSKDNHVKVRVAIITRVVNRGNGTGSQSYGAWRTWIQHEFTSPQTDITWVGDDTSGYDWSIPFSSITQDGTTALAQFAPLDFATRIYDSVQFQVHVRIWWGATDAASETGTNDNCVIEWIPTYVASYAKWQSDGLHLGYTVANWNRINDRFQLLTDIRANSSTITNKLVAAKGIWGTIAAAGDILIPASEIQYIPATGDLISTQIRMNAVYRASGDTDFTRIRFSGISAEGITVSYGIDFVATATDDGVLVTVSEASGGSHYTSFEVSLVGSDYSFDKAVIEPGGSYLFEYVPFGVETVWQAIGYTTAGSFSDPCATATVSAIGVNASGAHIKPIDGSAGIAIEFNESHSRQVTPETEIVKLAGRPRQSAFYGEGGEVEISIDGAVFTEGGHGSNTYTVVTAQDIEDLVLAGICVLRLRNGSRKLISITDAKADKVENARFWLNVSIKAQEVV